MGYTKVNALQQPSSTKAIAETFPYRTTARDSSSMSSTGGTFTVNVDSKGNHPYIVRTLTSEVTPGYSGTKKVQYMWKPKKYPLIPPRRPRFKPPEPYAFRAPVKASRLARALKRYELYLSKLAQRRADYIRVYNQKLARYESRMRNYEALVKRSQTPRYYYVKQKACKKTDVRNPFSSSTVIQSGWNGTIATFTLCQRDPDGRIRSWGGPYTYRRDVWKYRNSASGLVFATPGQSYNSMLDATDHRAIRKIYDQLANASGVHLGNILAERKQTFSMVSQTLVRLIQLARDPKRYLSSYIKNAKQNVSDDTLVWLFGIRPLLDDLYSSLKLLSNGLNENPKVIIKSQARGEDHVRGSSGAQNQTYDGVKTFSVHTTVRVFYSIEYQVENQALSVLESLGLVNPAEILWEVTPWSFVIDWFLPIGQYISSFAADSGLKFVGGTKTITKRSTSTTDHRAAYYVSDQTSFRYIDRQCFKQESSKVRTVLTSAPKMPLPALKNPFSITHLIEALALIVQRLR